jgi:hypothetical protein
MAQRVEGAYLGNTLWRSMLAYQIFVLERYTNTAFEYGSRIISFFIRSYRLDNNMTNKMAFVGSRWEKHELISNKL